MVLSRCIIKKESYSDLQNYSVAVTQEAKYVESWPNTISSWTGWSRFDIPVDRHCRIHTLLECTGASYLPLG
jgi:hypothetical protein